jgi:hypothetical protein
MVRLFESYRSLRTTLHSLFCIDNMDKFSSNVNDINNYITKCCKKLNMTIQINHAYYTLFFIHENRIGNVMISVLAPSLVDRGFEPRSGETKDYTIGICCFSANMQH